MRIPGIIVFIGLLFFSACREKPAIKPEVTKERSLDSKRVVPPPKPEIPLPDISRVMGKFNPANDPQFIRIDTAYTDKPAIYLQREAYSKFLEMRKAAQLEGIELKILSATRPFDYQRNIWERKWRQLQESGWQNRHDMALEILKYSAMPGTSRHHWGTDIDLNYLSNPYFESGQGQATYAWLVRNAHRYGFCQPYTAKGPKRPEGYEEEKWHWSYIPLAKSYYQRAKNDLTDDMITGFSGAESAGSIGVVEKFVLGVDPRCK